MEVFRLCLKERASLDGQGARLYGGRWNSPGHALIYTSQHLSLAVLEYIVHVEPNNLPDKLIWLKICIPDDVSFENFSGAIAPAEFEASQIGDKWIKLGKTVALIVPSAVLPLENNVLINPKHSDMSRISIIDQQLFFFDQRLFKVN
jgi:RES domain-containing protein